MAGRRRKRRRQWFESGEMKYVILSLIRRRPTHGYEVMKALEDQTGGYYKPSPGTIYPTLQWLEDQGFVEIKTRNGKKVYHITTEGESFLDEHRSEVNDIFERVEQMMDYFVGGKMPDIHKGVGRLVGAVYRSSWRHRDRAATQKRILQILDEARSTLEDL